MLGSTLDHLPDTDGFVAEVEGLRVIAEDINPSAGELAWLISHYGMTFSSSGFHDYRG